MKKAGLGNHDKTKKGMINILAEFFTEVLVSIKFFINSDQLSNFSQKHWSTANQLYFFIRKVVQTLIFYRNIDKRSDFYKDIDQRSTFYRNIVP